MSSQRNCLVCGRSLDTLFERAKRNVKTCSNKCRQKRYRDRKRHPGGDARSNENDLRSHEADQGRARRVQAFSDDCLKGLNPFQKRSNKGPGGLHASPNSAYLGIDT